MPYSALPEHLRSRKHNDWPWPFSMIPRAWNSFNWGPPKLLWGTGNSILHETVIIQWKAHIWYAEAWDCPKPIGPPDSWQISYFPLAPWWAKPLAWYVAKSFARGEDGKYRQVRFGARWDDVDRHKGAPNGYVTWPTFPTGRRYTGDDTQNTQSWV